MLRRRFSLFLLLAPLLALALVLVPAVAQAHARYVRSEPPFNAAVRDAPARVTIWFSEELDKASRIRVQDQRGERVDNDKTEVSLNDPKSMSVGLKRLATGAYLVEWNSISLEDKDVAEGSFTFSVGQAPIDRGGAGTEAAVGLALSALALLTALLALLRSRRRAA